MCLPQFLIGIKYLKLMLQLKYEKLALIVFGFCFRYDMLKTGAQIRTEIKLPFSFCTAHCL